MYFNHDSVKQVFCPCPICSSTLTHLSSTNGLFFFKRLDASAFQSFSRSLLCNDAFPPERAPFGRHTCSFKVLLKKKKKKSHTVRVFFFFLTFQPKVWMLWRVATVAMPMLLWAGPLWCQQCERKPRRVGTSSLKKKEIFQIFMFLCPNVWQLWVLNQLLWNTSFPVLCCNTTTFWCLCFVVFFCFVFCCKNWLWFLNFLNNHVGHNYSFLFD